MMPDITSRLPGFIPRRIVGLCGYARAGKDTIAAELIAKGWRRFGFADALKEDVGRCIQLPFDRMAPADKEFWRPLLVQYAVLRRQQSPDYWIHRLVDEVQSRTPPSQPVIITDVRYRNEVEWIQRCGGLVCYVEHEMQPACEEEERSIREAVPLILPENWILNRGTVGRARHRLEAAVVQHYGKNGTELEGWPCDENL